MEVDKEQIYIQFSLVVLSARSRLAAWMHWSCIDVIVLVFKSVEGLYPSPPLGVDSADTTQLPKERLYMDNSNTSKEPSLAVVPLHLCNNRGGYRLMSHLFFPFYDVVVGLYTDITLLDYSVYGPEYVPVLYFPTPFHVSTDLDPTRSLRGPAPYPTSIS
jgi:hypothetical protein